MRRFSFVKPFPALATVAAASISVAAMRANNPDRSPFGIHG
jgi:hypothetical protein